jgi:hypothetical protein
MPAASFVHDKLRLIVTKYNSACANTRDTGQELSVVCHSIPMQNTSINQFNQYADVFYRLPEFLPQVSVPDFGAWVCPEDMSDGWAGKHFIQKLEKSGRFSYLATHASNLRQKIPCRVVFDEVIAGGQHMVLKIKFRDGVTWLARFRFPNCEQGDDHVCVGGYSQQRSAECQAEMESEIATLKHISDSTSVPVPRVYGYDLCQENTVGAMYLLMD